MILFSFRDEQFQILQELHKFYKSFTNLEGLSEIIYPFFCVEVCLYVFSRKLKKIQRLITSKNEKTQKFI
jgi:hypothetical protein